jgi:hypothetical protein
MCCFFVILGLLGPRVAGAFWWIFAPARWTGLAGAFEGFFVPLLGLIFLPWTTLTWVLVYPADVSVFEWILLALAVFLDLAAWFGAGLRGRDSFAT